jgi:8-oxo-dGTP pyrophosphatase MutT (NUDIX family)
MNQPTGEAKRAAPVPLRHAATVLLLREDAGKLEVLMMRRPSTMVFMADAWVFPGGGQDIVDTSPEMLARARSSAGPVHCALCDAAGERLGDEQSLSLMITACRETFEEAGILLARHGDGSKLTAAARAKALAVQAEVTEQPQKLARWLDQEGLFLDVERLVYWSHWITPPFEKRRFDTRFFAIGLTGDQCEVSGTSESMELRWLKPAAALEAQQAGTMKLMPPTLITLEDLLLSYSNHGGIQAMLEAESQRITPPLMPKLFLRGDKVDSVMPWDPGYPSLPGEGYDQAAATPGHYSRLRTRLQFSLPAAQK